MLLAAAALSALSALGATASVGKTAPPALDLSWAATPPCSSREEVQAEVARLLRAAEGDERAVLAHATLTESDAGAIEVDLRLEIAGALHRRAFEAESCQAAKSAIALILAIAINPAAAKVEGASAPLAVDTTDDAGAAAVLRASSPSPSRSPSPSPLTSPRSAPAPTRTSRIPLALWLGVSGIADVGTLPRLGAGGEIELTCQLGHARLEGAASFLGAQHATESTSEAGATFATASGHLRFAYGGALGRVWLAPFASFGVTHLTASGSKGTLTDFVKSEPVPEVGAGGLLSWQAVSVLGMRLSAEAMVPTFRPRFVVVEPEPAPKQRVFQSSRVAGRVMIGVTLQFL